VALGAIADEGKGVVLEVFLALWLVEDAIEIKSDAIDTVADSQEASLWASRHALFAG
jgi:hypothetical protein